MSALIARQQKSMPPTRGGGAILGPDKGDRV
jgi:hypothetical protein